VFYAFATDDELSADDEAYAEPMATISMPLDGDGFIRRACAACEREFKCLYADDPNEGTEPDARGFCCPYCAMWADLDSWFTEAQLEFLGRAGLAAVADEVNEVLSQPKNPGGFVKYTPAPLPAPEEMSPESNDMRRVDFRCHPADPLKVIEEWDQEIHCLICGSTA
jgi:hypothetical protein